MKITLEHLNEKWWYRFLKVVYGLAFAFSLVVPVVAIVVDSISYKPSYCKEKIKENIGVSLGKKQVQKILDDAPFGSDKKVILDGLILRGYELEGLDSKKIKQELEIQREKDCSPNINWFSLFGYSSLSIIATLVVFIGGRRVFYYIALGKFFPEKK